VSNKALLRNIYYGFGQYELKKADKPKLEPLVNSMKENPDLKIEIAGHTDDIGDWKMNLHISLLRARAVAKYLEERR